MQSSNIQYKSLQIEPTNRCNLKCRICWHTLGDINKYGDLDFSLFKDIIDQFDNIYDLNLQGLGEPFLAPQLLNMVSYASRKGIDVWLASNLNTYIDYEFAESIIKSGIAKIRISIDASNERSYSAIKEGGNLKKVIEAICLINKAKKKLNSNLPILAFNTVSMRRNISDLNNIIKLAYKLNVKEIALIPLVIFNKGLAVEKESLSNSKNIHLVKKYMSKVLITAKNLGIVLEVGISAMAHPEEMGLKRNESPRCTWGCYVDCFGSLYPCCNVNYSFGSFISSTLDEMIRGERYQFFIAKVVKKKLPCVLCMEMLNKFK